MKITGADLVRENRELREELLVLRGKIARYEEPLPLGKGNCYHRFTDEGICIRCGEDAESWDAGCVEEIVEDLMSVTTREFADALRGLIRDQFPDHYLHIGEKYLERIEKFAAEWDLVESWKEKSDVDTRVDTLHVSDSDSFALSL